MTRNTDQNEDLRVQRTHKLIQEALLELSAQKGFATLTVSDLTEYAGINRATFYRHYTDKFDLLDKYAQSVYDLLDTALQRHPKSGQPDENQITSGLIIVLEHIRKNARFYRLMLGKKGDLAFTEKIRQYIQKRIGRSLPTNLPKDKDAVDLYIAYSSSASMGAVLWWLEHEFPYSSEEMVAILQKFELANVSVILKKID